MAARGNLLPPPQGLLFPISSKLFYRQDSTYHDFCYTNCKNFAKTDRRDDLSHKERSLHLDDGNMPKSPIPKAGFTYGLEWAAAQGPQD